MKKQTLQEWRQEAIDKFGDNGRDYKFKCPKCGNEQTALDFVEKAAMSLKDAVNRVYVDCIGRHTKDHGCDWAAYGLFGTMGKGRIVIDGEGKEHEIFDFAEGGKK